MEAGRSSAPASPGHFSPQKRHKKKDFAFVGSIIAEKYKVLEVLGQGGFGTVFLVEITAGMVGEKLALKLLPEELSLKPSFRNQFLNEIRLAMRLVDKYVVQIRDVGTTAEGLLYYTMDYCPGTTLAQILRQEGRIAVSRAILIALNVLRALQTAHAGGIIHRDLKPANLMVETQGGKEVVRVLDLGIATAIEGAADPSPGKKTGFSGSPHYMPPEQFLGAEIGFYTDLYSVGVILYECLTGQRPYPGSTPQEVFKCLKSRAPPQPETISPEIVDYPGLADLVLKALERNPEKRFQSAREFFDALNAILLRGTAVEKPPPPAGSPAAGRKIPERIRRRGVIRRSSSRAFEVVVGTLFTLALVLGGLFHKEILSFWHSGGEPNESARASSPGAGGAPGGETASLPGMAQPPARTETPPPPDPAPLPPQRALPPQGEGPQQDERDSAIESRVLAQQKMAAAAEFAARAEHFLAEGEEALQRQDWTAAIERADAVLRQDPRHAGAHRLRGVAALRKGDFVSAEGSLDQARILLKGETIEPSLLLALAEAKMGLTPPKAEEAETLAVVALKGIPNEPGALLFLGRVLEKEGKVEELKTLLTLSRKEKVESPELDELWRRYFVEGPKKRAEEASRLLARAREAFAKGDWKSSSQLARESDAAFPSFEAEVIAADSSLEQGEVDGGKSILEKSLEREQETPESAPEQPGRERLPAEARLALEARLAALRGQSCLLQHEEKKSDNLIKSAEAFFLEAGEKLAKLEKKDQGRVALFVRFGLARARASRGDLDGVLEAFKLLPEDGTPKVVLEQSRVYYLAGRKADAKELKIKGYDLARKRLLVLLKLRGLTPELKAEAWFLLGAAHLRLGELQGAPQSLHWALEDFAEAQRAGFKSAELYEKWGTAHDRIGNLIKAAQMFRTAYETEKTPASCLRAADSCLKINPRSPDALALLKEGRELFPDDKEVLKKFLELSK
jgi:serine/threonine-protein kinase